MGLANVPDETSKGLTSHLRTWEYHYFFHHEKAFPEQIIHSCP